MKIPKIYTCTFISAFNTCQSNGYLLKVAVICLRASQVFQNAVKVWLAMLALQTEIDWRCCSILSDFGTTFLSLSLPFILFASLSERKNHFITLSELPFNTADFFISYIVYNSNIHTRCVILNIILCLAKNFSVVNVNT